MHGRPFLSIGSSIRIHSTVRDAVITSAASFVIAVVNPLVISVLAHKLGPVALGEYLLLRRLATWLWAAGLMGLGVGIPRYIAKQSDDKNAPESCFLAGALCVISVCLVITILLNSASAFFSRWLFGSVKMERLILPLNLLTVALIANTLVYGYYQGLLEMKRANALNLLSLGLVPVIAVVGTYSSGSVELIIGSITCGTAICALIFAAPIFARRARITISRVRLHAEELLRFGLRRLPGDLALNTLFVAGPIVASHYVATRCVAALLLGINLLLFCELTLAPIGTVMLSKVSHMLAQHRSSDVARALSHWTVAVIELSTFVCLQLVIFADVLVRIWVGPAMAPETGIVRIVLLSIPCDLVYVALRSPIDAATVRAYNAENVIVALGTFVVLSLCSIKMLSVHLLAEGIAAALVGAFVTIALLTLRTLGRVLGVRIQWREVAASSAVSILLASIVLAVRWARGFTGGIAEFMLVETAVNVLLVASILTLKPSWVGFLKGFVLPAATHPSHRALAQ